MDSMGCLSLCPTTRKTRRSILKARRLFGENGTELVELVLKYYGQLSEKYRKMIPLKMVYIPVTLDTDSNWTITLCENDTPQIEQYPSVRTICPGEGCRGHPKKQKSPEIKGFRAKRKGRQFLSKLPTFYGGELGIRTLGSFWEHSISSAAPSTTRTTLRVCDSAFLPKIFGKNWRKEQQNI